MGELERLLGDDKLSRPTPSRNARTGRLQRDPGAEWDWFYELDPKERAQLSRRFMGGKVAPDVLATWLATDVDSAMEQWRTACRLELDGLTSEWDLPPEDDYDDLVGLVELATAFETTPANVRKWRARGKLPAPDYVVSGTPIWRWGPLREQFARPGTDPGAEREQEQQI